uniref:Uncharacterized protein n=1 Tax=Serratia phage Kevin TaxID=3161161 RepID=A0AAU8KWV9_9CAUD
MAQENSCLVISARTKEEVISNFMMLLNSGALNLKCQKGGTTPTCHSDFKSIHQESGGTIYRGQHPYGPSSILKDSKL